jgi:hypothetical protein
LPHAKGFAISSRREGISPFALLSQCFASGASAPQFVSSFIANDVCDRRFSALNTLTRCSEAVMIVRTCAPILLVALTVGCQSGQQTALMENELRWVEDQYYQLEGVLQAKCKELESCRLENQALRQQLAGDSRSTTSSGTQRRPVDTPRPSSRRTINGSGESSPPIAPPTVEGLPDLSSGSPSVLHKPEADEVEPRGSLSPLPSTEEESPSPEAFELPGLDAINPSQSGACDPLYDATVTHVVLNRQLTGGYDFDGHAGDEGILVVAEPRNAAGQFVPLAGGLDISLRDPNAKPGEEEIAKWRLDAHQAQAKVKKSLLGRGVHIELPWPGAPPEREELTLQVSYTTVDGRTLKTERDIHVDPPRQLSARWTPALDEPIDSNDAPRPQIMHEPFHVPSPQPREAATIRKTATVEEVNGGPQWSPFR